MQLTITSSNSRNTEFVTENGQLWYTVETPWKLGSRTTTFTRTQPKAEVIGQIIWKTVSQSRVRIGSTMLDRKDFLRSKGALSSHLLMTGTNGLEYEWKHTNSEPELWSLSTGRCVAHFKSSNIFKGRKRALTIEPEGEPIMDIIIVAFTIIDKRKKDSQTATIATVNAANANVAASG